MDVHRVTQDLTEKVRQEAWRVHLERVRSGASGTPQEDWLKAEEKIRPFKPYVTLAAYFNSLHRSRKGEPPDDMDDWLRAEAIEMYQWSITIFTF